MAQQNSRRNNQNLPRIKELPYNIDAEIYVLGSVFLDNKIMRGYVGKVTEDFFISDQNKEIYRAMLNLYNDNQEIDLLTICDELKRLNVNVDENYRLYLVDMIESVPSTSNTNLYLNILEEKAIERYLVENMESLTNNILENSLTFNEILEKAEDKILEVVKKRRTSQIMGIEKASQIVYDRIDEFQKNDKELTGLNTGYPQLNSLTLGFQKGDLMILAARPSVGKSTFAINLAMQVSKLNQAHVALFSLEMSIEQLLLRMYSCESEVDLKKMRSGTLTPEEMTLIGIAKQELAKLHIYFDEDSSSNIADIRAKCRRLKAEGKLDFVVIDYLQLITNPNSKNRQEEVSGISRALKVLARELEVPVLALSQLSRNIEGRENKKPVLADLRESGSIEQDADIVFFIMRRKDIEEQEDTLIETDRTIKAKDIEEIVLTIEKNRQGKLGYIDYHFYGSYCYFKEQKFTKELILKKSKRRKKSE